MQYNAARTAQTCAVGKQNNHLTSAWLNTRESTPQVSAQQSPYTAFVQRRPVFKRGVKEAIYGTIKQMLWSEKPPISHLQPTQSQGPALHSSTQMQLTSATLKFSHKRLKSLRLPACLFRIKDACWVKGKITLRDYFCCMLYRTDEINISY